MRPVRWLSHLFSPEEPEFTGRAILPIKEQIRACRHAGKKMKWAFGEEEFSGLDSPPSLTDNDLEQGFADIALFYGFGDDSTGHADAVLSVKLAWDYACRRLRNKAWQSPHIDFDKPDSFRLRPTVSKRNLEH